MFIRPGKPVENCLVESFDGRIRDECLNVHWFLNVDDARRRVEAWRIDFNCLRPQSSLGYEPPSLVSEGAGLLPTASASAPPILPPTQKTTTRGP